jgi:hypothetical protein
MFGFETYLLFSQPRWLWQSHPDQEYFILWRERLRAAEREGFASSVGLGLGLVHVIAGAVGQASQIDNDIADRSRAAYEKIAVGGHFKRLRFVNDRPRNQTALTIVTNARPARPPDRNVASFGQLQNALVRRLPMCGDAAPCERHQRTGVGVVLRHMRRSPRCADHTRGPRLAAIEEFGVNSL